MPRSEYDVDVMAIRNDLRYNELGRVYWRARNQRIHYVVSQSDVMSNGHLDETSQTFHQALSI
jgi:hypothetical protein